MQLRTLLYGFALAGVLAVMPFRGTSHAPGLPFLGDLDHPDYPKISASVGEQLDRLDLGSPQLNLFPDQPTEGEMRRNILGYFVDGVGDTLTKEQKDNMHLDMNGGLFKKDPPVDPAYFDSYPAVYRVRVGIHETMHLVSDKLGLDQQTFQKMPIDHLDSNDRSLLADAVSERIADVGAILYALSNTPDKAQVERLIDDTMIRRSVRPQTDHYTVPCITAAVRAFAVQPSYGADLKKCALWAAQIVGTEHDLALNLGAHKQAYRQILSGITPDGQSDYRDQVVADAKAARARLLLERETPTP